MRCNISIHDVAPSNLNRINEIINYLSDRHSINKITLLIIPGLPWEEEQINKLTKWQNTNRIELAAHGWIHKSKSSKNILHFLHSKLISDDCAEHLSRSKEEIIKIMNDSFSWFNDNGLKSPTLYVPPAWAMGELTKKDIESLPFNEVEVTSGVFINSKFNFIPLIGFETKTYLSFLILKILNKFNYILYMFYGKIRIAIHPDDFNLLLKKDIDKYLQKVTDTFQFSELV